MSQKSGDVTTYFSYDSAGNLIGMSAGGKRYFYTRNAQNDITGLIDENGTSVVQYQYDSWGKLLGITGSLANTIGKRNPFRYRGYYYDDETGMYYLQSRYYDPEIKRFICADDIDNVSDLQEMPIEKNLYIYIYCDNNPIARIDTNGRGWLGVAVTGLGKAVQAVVSGVTSLASSISNGDNWVQAGATAVANFGMAWCMRSGSTYGAKLGRLKIKRKLI